MRKQTCEFSVHVNGDKVFFFVSGEDRSERRERKVVVVIMLLFLLTFVEGTNQFINSKTVTGGCVQQTTTIQFRYNRPTQNASHYLFQQRSTLYSQQKNK